MSKNNEEITAEYFHETINQSKKVYGRLRNMTQDQAIDDIKKHKVRKTAETFLEAIVDLCEIHGEMVLDEFNKK